MHIAFCRHSSLYLAYRDEWLGLACFSGALVQIFVMLTLLSEGMLTFPGRPLVVTASVQSLLEDRGQEVSRLASS